MTLPTRQEARAWVNTVDHYSLHANFGRITHAYVDGVLLTREEWAATDDMLELAWGLIANSYGGNWNMASKEWEKAAERWRDRYHETLPVVDAAVGEENE